MNQLTTDLFHRDPLGFVRLRVVILRSLIEPRTSAAAELLGPQGRNIYEEKPVGHERRRLNRLQGLHFFLLRCFEFHNNTGYWS